MQVSRKAQSMNHRHAVYLLETLTLKGFCMMQKAVCAQLVLSLHLESLQAKDIKAGMPQLIAQKVR